MEQAKQVALDRAIALLKAAGVQYAIITPGGMKYGDLDVRVKQPRQESKVKRTGFDYTTLWKPVFAALQPGDMHTFTIPAGLTIANLHSAISAAACSTFGNGKCIVSRDTQAGTVQILRVE